MLRKKILGFSFAFLFLSSAAFADDSMQYNQKTLPNGDIETTYSSSDGTKVTSLQHKDGSVETNSVAADGTKSSVIQHKDGSVESHVSAPKDS